MSETAKLEVPIQDAHFYIDEMVTFQVGDVLFRLPKHIFVLPDTSFEAMFTIPPPPEANGVVEGSRDDCPIKLEGIEKAEFRSFVSLLYPINTGRISPQSVADWMGVHRLSNMWNFTKILDNARERLQHLLNSASGAEKVRLGREYGVKAWVETGYLQLVEHSGVLPPVDSLLDSGLSAKELCRVLMVREKLHIEGVESNPRCVKSWNSVQPSQLEMVRVELGAELKEIPVLDEHLLCYTHIPSPLYTVTKLREWYGDLE